VDILSHGPAKASEVANIFYSIILEKRYEVVFLKEKAMDEVGNGE
jgi:hypothetical protein